MQRPVSIQTKSHQLSVTNVEAITGAHEHASLRKIIVFTTNTMRRLVADFINNACAGAAHSVTCMGPEGSMIILWSLLLTVTASAQKVYDSNEDIGPEAFANVTTLYPVANITTNTPTTNQNPENNTDETNSSKLQSTEHGPGDTTANNNNSSIKEKTKTEATSWKIEAAFAEPIDKEDNKTARQEDKKSRWKNETKEFRPSQHLGIIDDVAPTKESTELFTPVIKKPASGFVSSKEEYRSTINKIPDEFYNTHKQFPYKVESSIFTRAKDSWRLDRPKVWPQGTPGVEGYGDRPGKGGHGSSSSDGISHRPGKAWSQETIEFDSFRDRPRHNWGSGPEALEPKPTVEAPVKVPAGGLYKQTDPFQENSGTYDGDYGLEYNGDNKENAIKKHENPWEGLLRMLTAFIPVGIIISALTPSIITIEDAPHHTYPSKVFRRADSESAPAPPAISERCRRRLLCELHSDHHYDKQRPPNPRKKKQCYRIRCEDPEALAKTLRWLLDKQTNRHYT